VENKKAIAVAMAVTWIPGVRFSRMCEV
jgi:hypothetical protein